MTRKEEKVAGEFHGRMYAYVRCPKCNNSLGIDVTEEKQTVPMFCQKGAGGCGNHFKVECKAYVKVKVVAGDKEVKG